MDTKAANTVGSVESTESRLLAVVAGMLRESRGTSPEPLSLDDSLESGLGLDSLSRMELMLRLEQAFQVRLPEAAVQQAQTLRDLLASVASAVSSARPRAAVARQEPEATAQATSLFDGAPENLPAGQGAVVRRAAEAVARAGIDQPAPTSLMPPVAPAAPTWPGLPRDAATLIDVLRWHARSRPEHLHIRLLDLGGEVTHTLTNRQLLNRGQAVAAALSARGLQPGDRAALMLPTCLGFFEAFTGILLAGGVPVPIYPPLRAAQIEDHLRRQARILDNAQAVMLIADELTEPAARLLPRLRQIVTLAQLTAPADGGEATAPPRCADDIAFLQYTSGSTGQPKGVVVTHATLLANLRAMGEGTGVSGDDVFVSWLPLYHDMGLIGAWMGSLYFGMALVLMPPQAFLARPSRWLQAIHRHGGTVSAAPNFAYEILATRVPDTELAGLDLSRWRFAFNGAEPVRAGTLARFAKRFAPYGFDARAMMPVYGLAESGLGLAFPAPRRGLRVDTISRSALHRSGRAEALAAEADVDVDAMQVVSCGMPLPGHQIRAVDALGREVPERTEGRIEFRGPSATPGYFRNPEATRALLHGDWRDTGDIGYLAGGELYLTSRVKDLIIRGGHNIHPYDLEEAVGQLPGVRRGCVAVFGATDPGSGTDRVVVMAETHEVDAARRAELRRRIADLSVALLGVPADDIVLAEAHGVLKTSSGKIRRAACRELYESGRIGAPARSVGLQMMRLWSAAQAARVRAGLRLATGAIYAAALWTMALTLALLAAVALLLLPRLQWRHVSVRFLARALLRASCLPLRLQGAEHLASGGPWVVVANHASYIDGVLLAALLPAGVRFVAKRELIAAPAVGLMLRRLGTQFVERGDMRESVEDSRRLVEAARQGASLVFFPEGTLTREPGLRAFRMGAFVVSLESGLPVLPVSLSGTRSVMRDGSWWPRRHALQVTVHAPLHPQGHAWADAVALRDASRQALAGGAGELVLA